MENSHYKKPSRLRKKIVKVSAAVEERPFGGRVSHWESIWALAPVVVFYPQTAFVRSLLGYALGRQSSAVRGFEARPTTDDQGLTTGGTQLLQFASYLLTVKSALLSPATVTDLDEAFAPSCHATTVYWPSGTFSILYSPLLSVFAKYAVGETTI